MEGFLKWGYPQVIQVIRPWLSIEPLQTIQVIRPWLSIEKHGFGDPPF